MDIKGEEQVAVQRTRKWQGEITSAEGQGLISGVNMGEGVREAGTVEGEVNGQGRENGTRSDNSREEEQEESFQVHNIRGVC